VDAVLGGALRVIQRRKGYRFSLDAVLLADFATSAAGAAWPATGRVLELGGGNGVVAMILAHRSPVAHVTAVEIQPAMVERARRSVALNGLDAQVTVIEADVRRLDGAIPSGAFDGVVANPPFFAPDNRPSPDAEKALARHGEVRDFLAAGARALAPHGRMHVVFPAPRWPSLQDAALAVGLRPVRLRWVHARAGEPAKLVLATLDRSNEPVETLPPLVLHQPGARTYTPEAAKILGEEGAHLPVDP